MNNIKHIANIYLNLYIKRTNIFYRSLKMQYNSIIAHSFILYLKFVSIVTYSLYI